MASLDSFIRSAAQATSSAFRRLPIRWRVAGGSAVLTLVILLGFAVAVGALTTQRLNADFNREVRTAADDLVTRLNVRVRGTDSSGRPNLHLGVVPRDYAAGQRAAVRIVTQDDRLMNASPGSPDFGVPRTRSAEVGGWRVETREVTIRSDKLAAGVNSLGTFYVQYARPISQVRATVSRVQVFLAVGVLGGAALALLAGLAIAGRAMRRVAQLTKVAKEIERTGNPNVSIPHPEAEDEVAELARTLEGMLRSLAVARVETEAALARQREFVADASHELRTPLTAVLANLELLEESLTGEPKEAAASALRSSRRMRRLVADLLLLARADTGRHTPHIPLDLSEVVTEAASEMEPLAGEHPITVDVVPGATIRGARDELHRLVANLLENALRHTDPGTAVEASVARENGEVVLAVEDDGPGIPDAMREKVFERFFRGAGDRSGSSGLGLAIVRAVAESHQGTVTLEPPLDGRGARFVIRLPAEAPHSPE